MRTAALCLAATLALPVTALAQSGKTPSPPQTTRPPEAVQYPPQSRVHIYGQVYIGERAPDFSLDGSDGKLLKLSRHKGDWVLLSFSDRKEALAPLREIHDEMRALGVQIVGVCKEKAHTLQVFAARDTLPFVLGADFTGEIAALYGLFDTGRSTISPGLLMIDRDGWVRMALLGQPLPPAHVARLARFAVTGQ
jgi:peroxiredoxin Q/BCP